MRVRPRVRWLPARPPQSAFARHRVKAQRAFVRGPSGSRPVNASNGRAFREPERANELLSQLDRASFVDALLSRQNDPEAVDSCVHGFGEIEILSDRFK